jgi:hypothetical protein
MPTSTSLLAFFFFFFFNWPAPHRLCTQQGYLLPPYLAATNPPLQPTRSLLPSSCQPIYGPTRCVFLHPFHPLHPHVHHHPGLLTAPNADVAPSRPHLLAWDAQSHAQSCSLWPWRQHASLFGCGIVDTFPPPFFLADNPQHCAALQHVPLSTPLPLFNVKKYIVDPKYRFFLLLHCHTFYVSIQMHGRLMGD